MATMFALFILIIGMLTLVPHGASRFPIVPVVHGQAGCGCSKTLTLLAILVVLLIVRFA